MKKNSLWLITVLMSIALIGVCILQWFSFNQAFTLRSQLFTQNVNKALNALTEQVQRRNAIGVIVSKDLESTEKAENSIRSHTDKIVNFREQYKFTEEQRKNSQQRLRYEYLNFQDNNIRQGYITPIVITEEEFQFYNNTDANIIEGLELAVASGIDADGNLQRRLIPKFLRPNLQMLVASQQVPDTIRYIALSTTDQLPRLISLPSRDVDLESKFLIEDANSKQKYKLELDRLYADTVTVTRDNKDFIEDVQKEIQAGDVPIEHRIGKSALDSLLKSELNNQGIDLNYNFWLGLARKDSLIYKNTNLPLKNVDTDNLHKVNLFSRYVIQDPGILYVNFPNQQKEVLTGMSVNLIVSIGFIVLLIGIFAFTLYSIIKQKKISEMKSDFINNMTHEFKMPVATIMLASEALKESEAPIDEKRVNRLAGIIYDENIRLGNHIERVLNIAKLEQKELEFDKQVVDIHHLIEVVKDSMELQLQKKNAQLILNFEATDSFLEADELHLSNVLFNLIDNANKYSNDSPEIVISTKGDADKIILSIRDNGIGMTKEHIKRIFDQFYRVPTGNVHDVKGFGLGLNYVQDIVKEMKGSIKVMSEKDKGTTFELHLPRTS